MNVNANWTALPSVANAQAKLEGYLRERRDLAAAIRRCDTSAALAQQGRNRDYLAGRDTSSWETEAARIRERANVLQASLAKLDAAILNASAELSGTRAAQAGASACIFR